MFIILGNESEIVNKKRKSFTQATAILNSPDYKEFSEDYFLMESQFENLQKHREELLKVEQNYYRLVQTFKSYVDDGSKTIIRSMFEVVIRKYEEKLYNEAVSLFCFYYNKPFNDTEDSLFAFSQEDINTILTQPCYSSYRVYCESLMFLKVLNERSLSRSEKLTEIRIHYSEHVSMPNNIDNLPSVARVGENVIRNALSSIFGKLSDEIHQASARFDGDSGNFILPRATGSITVADSYAFAIIVKEAGLNPVYPNPQQEQSLVQQEQSLVQKLFLDNK